MIEFFKLKADNRNIGWRKSFLQLLESKTEDIISQTKSSVAALRPWCNAGTFLFIANALLKK